MTKLTDWIFPDSSCADSEASQSVRAFVEVEAFWGMDLGKERKAMAI
jgi:hypothetical protein